MSHKSKSIKPKGGGGCGNVSFIACWLEAQVTIWTCDWRLKSQGDSLVGLIPQPVDSDALSRYTVSELNRRTPAWCLRIAWCCVGSAPHPQKKHIGIGSGNPEGYLGKIKECLEEEG